VIRRLGSLTAPARAGALVALTVLAGALLTEAVVADPERGHVFPVRGPHGERGPVGEFGAPRSGGRTHEGFDITAPCGTKLVAARGGRVLQNRFDPVLDGNEVLIHARGTGLNYRYSHLRKPAVVDIGEVVRTGQRIGGVGKTGNAVSVGCHLHFEMRMQGVAVDPEPALRRWDRFS
jgi:murein DD-endopeptidase MepM/ murein hydrolase activator NlpD